MKNKILKVFKRKLIPLVLSISSFSGILLFLLIGKKIDIPDINLSGTYFYRLNTDLIYIKYLAYLIGVLVFAYISIFLARKFLSEISESNPGETLSVVEIKPIEGAFLPVYIGLFVIALSFTEKDLSIETVFLMAILFLFWLTLDSVSYFNPFLLFFGYRFYEIKSGQTTTFTLISKRTDLKSVTQLTGLIRINNFTFLEN